MSWLGPVITADDIPRILKKAKERRSEGEENVSPAHSRREVFNSDGEHIGTFNPDPTDIPIPKLPPDIEAMRDACATGNLHNVRSAFKTHWLDVVPEKRHPKSDFGVPGLCEAIKKDDSTIVEYLLDNSTAMNEGHYIMATEYKAVSVLQLCVQRGWDINMKLSRCTPPALSLAITDLHLTKWFLANGANPNARCELDITPLSIAVRGAPFEVIELLFAHGGSIEYGQLIHFAVDRNLPDRLRVFHWILEKGARVNDIMFQNDPHSTWQEEFTGLGTPLHRAARNGLGDMVEILLSRGANPWIKDSMAWLPIDYANRRGHLNIVARLRQAMDQTMLTLNEDILVAEPQSVMADRRRKL
ncbi:MAG: hypothetical protein Q9172_001165 [Xanthocarpia lactea]